jgi:hypothetical protein
MNAPGSIALDDRQEWWVVRALQAALVGILGFGLYAGDAGVAVNAAGALAVSVLPALIGREYDLRTDPGVVALITLAVLLHVIGILGPYRSVSWWDTLTHLFSGLVVTGIGFAVVRAIDRYADAVHVPDRYLPVFLLVFALATGVFWEVIEFGVSRLSSLYGGRSVLVVYGPGDIVTDLIFTAVGGLLLAFWRMRLFRGLAWRLTGVLAR